MRSAAPMGAAKLGCIAVSCAMCLAAVPAACGFLLMLRPGAGDALW